MKLPQKAFPLESTLTQNMIKDNTMIMNALKAAAPCGCLPSLYRGFRPVNGFILEDLVTRWAHCINKHIRTYPLSTAKRRYPPGNLLCQGRAAARPEDQRWCLRVANRVKLLSAALNPFIFLLAHDLCWFQWVAILLLWQYFIIRDLSKVKREIYFNSNSALRMETDFQLKTFL